MADLPIAGSIAGLTPSLTPGLAGNDLLTITPLGEWTREMAKAAAALDIPPTYRVARRMLEEHEYWQDGDLWPAHQAGGEKLRLENLSRIKPQFVPDPLLEEISDTRANGMMQREAKVEFAPLTPAKEGSPAEQEQLDRISAMLSALARWWDQKKFWRHARAAFARTAYSRRASLRISVAPGNLRTPEPSLLQRMRNQRPGATLPTGLSLSDAFELLEVTAPDPTSARVYTDPATRRKAALVIDTVIQDGRRVERAEIWTTEGLGAKKTTTVRQIDNAGANVYPVNLQGRLPIAEMETAELFTDPVIKNQAALNFANTVMPRVLETAGFPQTFLGNVEPPGIWLPYAPTEEPALGSDVIHETTMWKHRVPWKFGFSAVSELVGVRQLERTGTAPNITEKESFATPSVTIKEPTDPTYIVTGKLELRATLYKLCRQGHLTNTSLAEASGLAYQQARAQFEAYLHDVKGEVEGMIRDAIEAAIAYAGLMSPEVGGFLDEFRCVVTMHVSSGPVTAADAAAAIQLRDAHLISDQTAMSRVGIEDPAAEEASIRNDPFMQLELSSKKAGALQSWTAATGEVPGDNPVAAHLAHLTPEESQAIQSGTVPQQGGPADGGGTATTPPARAKGPGARGTGSSPVISAA